MPSINRMSDAISQYEKFSSFTSPASVKDRTIVQVGQDTAGISSIEAKKKIDFVGHIARSTESRNANNAVRDLFKTTVIAMFGGQGKDDVSCIPEEIRTAMKLDDYEDKGKPLTARRIRAVKTAVDQYVDGRADQVAQKLAKQMGVGAVDDNLKGLIRTAVRSCGGDEDVLAAILENPKGVLVGNGPLGDEEVAGRVKDLAAAVDSLRQATGGDRKLFDAALPFLNDPKGAVPLAKPLLDGMVEVVDKLGPDDLAKFSTLKPGASGQDVHGAVVKLGEILDKAMSEEPLSLHVKADSPARPRYKDLLASMILSRAFPDDDSAYDAQKALDSEAASKVMRFCLQKKREFDQNVSFFAGLPPDPNDSTKLFAEQWTRRVDLLDHLKTAIDVNCTGSLSKIKPVKVYPNPVSEYTDHGLVQEIETSVRQDVTESRIARRQARNPY